MIRIGDLPTSKPLRTWLAALEDAEQVALDPHASWHDPAAVLTAVDLSDPARVLATLSVERFYAGVLTRVDFDRASPAILDLPLSGGEGIAWTP